MIKSRGIGWGFQLKNGMTERFRLDQRIPLSNHQDIFGIQRGSITSRIAVRSLPSISTDTNSGIQITSMPSS